MLALPNVSKLEQSSRLRLGEVELAVQLAVVGSFYMINDTEELGYLMVLQLLRQMGGQFFLVDCFAVLRYYEQP